MFCHRAHLATVPDSPPVSAVERRPLLVEMRETASSSADRSQVCRASPEIALRSRCASKKDDGDPSAASSTRRSPSFKPPGVHLCDPLPSRHKRQVEGHWDHEPGHQTRCGGRYRPLSVHTSAVLHDLGTGSAIRRQWNPQWWLLLHTTTAALGGRIPATRNASQLPQHPQGLHRSWLVARVDIQGPRRAPLSLGLPRPSAVCSSSAGRHPCQ